MNRLQEIFDKQKELMVKYHHIEVANGLVQTEDVPVNIHTREGQARLRDFAWRFTEEIGEALDSRETYMMDPTQVNKEDFQEELIDSLHFLTELSILAGFEPEDIMTTKPYHLDSLETLLDKGVMYLVNLPGYNYFSTSEGRIVPQLVSDLIQQLAMTINTLKNKVWKQSIRAVEEDLFEERLRQTWIIFFALLSCTKLTTDDIYKMYIFKNNKNKDRQKGGY